MKRRTVLKLGAAVGAVAGLGAGGRWLLPPAPSNPPGDVDELARRLVDTLDDDARRTACVPYDHPLRQYHNRGVGCGGLAIRPWTLPREQRALLVDLLHAGLSATGRRRVPAQYFVNWPGIHLLDLLVCGDPRSPPYLIMLSGPHLNLRIGGASPEGVAFGGPQVYGDQRGNGQLGLPGNLYRHQFEQARELFLQLDEGRRRIALRPEEPIQTRIALQGRNGTFDGVPVADLSPEQQARVSTLVDDILATWRAQDGAHARRCLAANGGIEALHLAWYQNGEEGPAGTANAWQIFRIEGPAAVFHFRGHPHVHAFVNVAMDGEAPLSVGEVIAHNPAALDDAAIKQLFEAALRHATGADLGYYPTAAVVGQLRAGPVSTGDVYCLESWQDSLAVVEVSGADLAPALAAPLVRRGEGVDPGRVYTVATTAWVSREPTGEIGRTRGRQPRELLLRDATIAYLREQGLPPSD